MSLNRRASVRVGEILAAGRAGEPAGEREPEAGAARLVGRGRAPDARLEDPLRRRLPGPAPSSATVTSADVPLTLSSTATSERP